MARPKNPTTILLEKKIQRIEEERDKLLQELELLKRRLPEEATNLPYRGISVFIDEFGKYQLVDIRYDIESGAAKVIGSSYFADAEYKASFNLKKMIAYGELYNKKVISKKEEE